MASFLALLGLDGHKSTQKISQTTEIVANAVQQTTQQSVNYVNGNNLINLSGSGNIVSDVTQTMSISVDSKTLAQVTQSATFQNTLTDTITQQIKNESIALTQWLDNSKEDNESQIYQSINTNVTSQTVQFCVNNINSQNILNVSGSGNVLAKVLQNSTVDMISQCLMGQDQSSKAINDITNTINQTSSSVSKNPFAFITDAIESVMKSAMAIAAIIFIVIVCFVGVLVYLQSRESKPKPEVFAPPGASSLMFGS